MFCEKLTLIHYFLANLRFSLRIFCVSENVLCKALYSGEKKRGLERLLDDLGFIPNLNHYCKKLALFMFLKPLLCTQDYAYVHMLWLVYAG